MPLWFFFEVDYIILTILQLISNARTIQWQYWFHISQQCVNLCFWCINWLFVKLWDECKPLWDAMKCETKSEKLITALLHPPLENVKYLCEIIQFLSNIVDPPKLMHVQISELKRNFFLFYRSVEGVLYLVFAQCYNISS